MNDDQDQTIRFAYAGNFYAAIDAFITGEPSILYAQAIRKTEVRVISKKTYREHIMDNPELAHIWRDILGWMVTGQLEREIDLLTNDPAKRYRRVLQRSPRLFQEVPAKYIANYLRMTPETLSRIRSTHPDS